MCLTSDERGGVYGGKDLRKRYRVVLRIFTSISILYFSALKLPSFSVLICSSFCIIALGSGQRLLYQLGSGLGLVLPYSVEVNILNVSQRYLLSLEWKRVGVMDNDSGHDETDELREFD